MLFLFLLYSLCVLLAWFKQRSPAIAFFIVFLILTTLFFYITSIRTSIYNFREFTMRTTKATKFIKKLNAIDALGLSFLLIIAFILQFALHELPCPLCLLQRVGILGITFGFLLNAKFKIRPGHYALSLLAALLTAAISVRQIFLHLLPGDPGYGLPFLGLHLYTWVFLFCFAVIIYIAIILSITPQYANLEEEAVQEKPPSFLKQLAFVVVFLMAVLNIISTYLECELKPCLDDPVKYQVQLIKPSS